MKIAFKSLVTFTLLVGCIHDTSGNTRSNDTSSSNPSVQVALAENDRQRLAANIADLNQVAHTECAGGYTLELYAPKEISYSSALRDTNKTSANAMFWVLRVPTNPSYSSYEMTVPNAWDKQEWFAERLADNRWLPVPKPPSMGSAHASLVDAPATFDQSDVRGDNVLPVDLRGPLPKVLSNPGQGAYRIHFPEFSAVIGGEKCTLDASFWQVNLI